MGEVEEISSTGGEGAASARAAAQSAFVYKVRVDVEALRAVAPAMAMVRATREAWARLDPDGPAKLQATIRACGGDPLDRLDAVAMGVTLTPQGTAEALVHVRARVADPVACLNAFAGDEMVTRQRGAELDTDAGSDPSMLLADGEEGGFILQERTRQAPPDAIAEITAYSRTRPLQFFELSVDVARARVTNPPRSMLEALLSGANAAPHRAVVEGMQSLAFRVGAGGGGLRAELFATMGRPGLMDELQATIEQVRLVAAETLPRMQVAPGAAIADVPLLVELLSRFAATRDGLRAGLRADLSFEEVDRLAQSLERALADYRARALTREARANLRMMYTLMAAYVIEHGEEPGFRLPADAPRTPRAVPRGVASPVDEGTFAHPTWQAIRVAPLGDGLRYSYEISVRGNEITFRALGDLDGDGRHSTYELRATRNGGELVGGGEFLETDPFE